MQLAILTVLTDAALIALGITLVALWFRAQCPVPAFVVSLLTRIGVQL